VSTGEWAFPVNKKAELHAHLNGCIPPSLVAELLPVEERVTSTTILRPVHTMQEYFRPWTVFRALATSADSTERIIQVAADCLAADGVVYAELRNSVRHLAKLNGITLREALEWLCGGMEEASNRTGVDLRLIVSLTREHFSLEAANRMLKAMASVEHSRLVGIDLTGDESYTVPREAARVFREAKDRLGMGVTIHAGESGPPDNVRWAIEECGATRIGHGLSAADDPACLELIREQAVCVEVCLTSNLLTGRFESLDLHPVRQFADQGIPFVLCTDNPQMHLRPLSFEYEIFSSLCPESPLLAEQFDTQMRYAFAPRVG
jgi:adenosine deaminase